MRKMILLALASLASAGAAQEIDCSTLQAHGGNTLTYTIPATFPNLPKSEGGSLGYRELDFNKCGVIATANGKGDFTLNAGSFDKLLKLVNYSNDNARHFSIYVVGVSGRFNPKDFNTAYDYSIRFDYNADEGYVDNRGGENPKLSVLALNQAVIGYKLDDGPLIPYFYMGKVTPANIPKDTKVIDIYTKRADYLNGYDRIRLDIENGIYQGWRTYPFPTN